MLLEVRVKGVPKVARMQPVHFALNLLLREQFTNTRNRPTLFPLLDPPLVTQQAVPRVEEATNGNSSLVVAESVLPEDVLGE